MVRIGDIMELIVYTRKECPLCDEGVKSVRRAIRRYPCTLTLIDVDSNETLRALYGDLVPVVVLDNEIIGTGPISALRIEQALSGRGLTPGYRALLGRRLSKKKGTSHT